MILLDYSGVAAAAFFANPNKTVEEGFLRHMILNSVRMYNVAYRAKYGTMVLACDSHSWRREVFPNYKAVRCQNRDDDKKTGSGVDWDQYYAVINKVREEIEAAMPYVVLKVEGAEADDVIGVLAARADEAFSDHSENVMIVSADHDFIQLHSGTTKQFSPQTKKLVIEKDPTKYLIEHIVRGDSGDGVPNILSPDGVFLTEGARQSPVSKKMVERITQIVLAGGDPIPLIKEEFGEVAAKGYTRNTALINLRNQPEKLKQEILGAYDDKLGALMSKTHGRHGTLLNYLIDKRCSMLIECISDFLPCPKL